MSKTNLFFSIVSILLISGCKTESSKESTEQKSKPNIIMIVADDMGWHDLSSYGNDFIETPNLDELANSGIRFTDAYAAAPLCSPSRASLMTGLHPISVNITEHIHGNTPAGPNQKLKTPPVSQQLDLEFTTLAEVLKQKGYRTGFIGKWHLGGGKFEPQHQGFDINIGGSYNGLPSTFFYPFFPEGQKPELQGGSKEGDYLTDVLTEKAVDYINQVKDSAFFLSLNYYSPHVPIEGKDSLVDKYVSKRAQNSLEKFPNAHYAAMVESIDINVGSIVKTLESLGLRDNTIILFTSDNGGLSVEEVPAFAKHTPPTDNGPLRAGKGYLYEGGIREPLIISWPSRIQGSQVNETPVIAQDFFNTFTEIVGSDTKAEGSESLVPIFNDQVLVERGLLWHLPHYSPQHGKPSSAYREGDWKIIRFYEDEVYELYNLKDDPSEAKNLSKDNPEKLEELKLKMDNQLKSLGAKFPENNPDYKKQ
jgi:arylsulfatase A-like enzyme